MGIFTDLVESALKPAEFAYDVYNSERNYNFQREQYNYQKGLQNRIFEREDNAVQRRMKDLKAAGMNPLLAAGGAASAGQAVTTTAPQVPGLKTSYADYMIAKAKADADISMTQAQQQLLNNQAEGARLNNELTKKTIKWYEDHPEYAPGVESGIYSGKGATSAINSFINGVQSSRLGRFAESVGESFAHATKQKPNPQYETVYKYHRKNGLSHDEADRRARKFVAKYK